jgi:ParB family transcriptional regulator, chromosome partitioning protein
MDTSNKTSKIAAILGEQIGKVTNNPLRYVDIDSIFSNPDQPRKHFDEEKLEELAQSIRQYGILQPIILQETDEEKYSIIAGERRWRACKIANVKTIPAIIKSPKEKRDSEAVALIENLQRQNLSITEEASYYANFIEKYEYTQEQLSQIIGKSRSHIANLLRINTLPESIKSYVEQQKISLGHAKIIAGRNDAEEIAKIIIEKNLNVRQTETWMQQSDRTKSKAVTKKDKKKDSHSEPDLDTDLLQIEGMLYEKIGAKVIVDKAKGEIRLLFKDFIELDHIIETLYQIPTKSTVHE